MLPNNHRLGFFGAQANMATSILRFSHTLTICFHYFTLLNSAHCVFSLQTIWQICLHSKISKIKLRHCFLDNNNSAHSNLFFRMPWLSDNCPMLILMFFHSLLDRLIFSFFYTNKFSPVSIIFTDDLTHVFMMKE